MRNLSRLCICIAVGSQCLSAMFGPRAVKGRPERPAAAPAAAGSPKSPHKVKFRQVKRSPAVRKPVPLEAAAASEPVLPKFAALPSPAAGPHALKPGRTGFPMPGPTATKRGGASPAWEGPSGSAPGQAGNPAAGPTPRVATPRDPAPPQQPARSMAFLRDLDEEVAELGAGDLSAMTFKTSSRAAAKEPAARPAGPRKPGKEADEAKHDGASRPDPEPRIVLTPALIAPAGAGAGIPTIPVRVPRGRSTTLTGLREEAPESGKAWLVNPEEGRPLRFTLAEDRGPDPERTRIYAADRDTLLRELIPDGEESYLLEPGATVRIATSTHADTQDYLLLDEDGTPVARIQFTLGS